jgi:hypothetical protein
VSKPIIEAIMTSGGMQGFVFTSRGSEIPLSRREGSGRWNAARTGVTVGLRSQFGSDLCPRRFQDCREVVLSHEPTQSIERGLLLPLNWSVSTNEIGSRGDRS